MSIHTDIRESVKGAMRAKDAVRLNVLRGLLSAFTNEAVAKKRKPDEELSDEEALAVINREARKRKDSIEQFERGGRQDLADSEKEELAILAAYLPEQMSREEVEKFVRDKFNKEKPDASAKGKFMGEIMRELKGRTDGAVVKETIDALFS